MNPWYLFLKTLDWQQETYETKLWVNIVAPHALFGASKLQFWWRIPPDSPNGRDVTLLSYLTYHHAWLDCMKGVLFLLMWSVISAWIFLPSPLIFLDNSVGLYRVYDLWTALMSVTLWWYWTWPVVIILRSCDLCYSRAVSRCIYQYPLSFSRYRQREM